MHAHTCTQHMHVQSPETEAQLRAENPLEITVFKRRQRDAQCNVSVIRQSLLQQHSDFRNIHKTASGFFRGKG